MARRLSMTAWINLAGLALAMSLSLISGVKLGSGSSPASADDRVATESAGELRVRRVAGGEELQDAAGNWFRLRPLLRIVSGSTIADHLLREFAPGSVVVANSYASQSNPDTAHYYADKPRLRPLGDLESVLALEPDLVITNTTTSDAKVQRLRDAGVTVFDLGSMRGMATFVSNIHMVAKLLNQGEQGRRYAARFHAEMEAVASRGRSNYRALYLSAYGTQLYTGGTGTSYNDVIHAAGLLNLAAEFEGWPQLNTEQVMAWSPEVIVTQRGMAETICGLAGLSHLPACADGRVIELLPHVLNDAGPGMVVAARAIYQALPSEL